MRIFALAVLSATAFAAAPAFAQDAAPGNVYVNLGYSHNWDDDIGNGLLGGRVGYQVNDNFAVEAEAGIGIVDDDFGGVNYSTDAALGAFVVATAPVSDNVTLLGRIGYTHSWQEAEIAGITIDEDDGSFGIGVGAQFAIDDVNAVRVDYTRYTENDGLNALGVSYVRKF